MTSLRRFDIYGHSIDVSYHGEGTFKSGVGVFATIVTYVLALITLFNLSVMFIDKSEQKENLQKIKVDSMDIGMQNLRQEDFFSSLTSIF